MVAASSLLPSQPSLPSPKLWDRWDPNAGCSGRLWQLVARNNKRWLFFLSAFSPLHSYSSIEKILSKAVCGHCKIWGMAQACEDSTDGTGQAEEDK